MDIESIYNKIVSLQYETSTSYDTKPVKSDVVSWRTEARDALKIALIEAFNEYQVEIAQLSAKVYAYEAIIANSNFKAALYSPETKRATEEV